MSDIWRENEPPLNQSRDQTREDIRRLLEVPTTLQGLGDLTVNLNTCASVSPLAAYSVEDLLAEHKVLKAKQVAAQSELQWEGSSAPLKQADVVHYATELFTEGAGLKGGISEMQTAGITRRLFKIKSQIQYALNMNLPDAQTYTPMFRS